MPTYDYQCRTCGTVTEVIHSMLEDGPTTCERCGGRLRRVLFPTGIIFKGSGFYRNDSRRPASGSAGAATGDSSAGGSSGAEAGSKSDGKPGSAASDKGGAPAGESAAKASTAGGDS
jgi:putative FmdB family regulatory protein